MANRNFNPEVWAESNTKRLSTGLYHYEKNPYDYTMEYIISKFKKTCPYRVYLKINYLALVFDDKTIQSKQWCYDNCSGYWYETTKMNLDNRSSSTFLVFIFEKETDAILFKLTCG